MNVLLVHNFYQQPGGEDQVFADEGKLLETHGHRVARFTMDNDAIVGMGKLTLARKTIWNKAAQVELRNAIERAEAHVVHFHNTFPLISPAAYYTAHACGAAVVQTLHNYRLLCPVATLYRDGHVCEQCLGRTIAWPAVVHGCYRDNRLASATIAAMLGYHHLRHTWSEQVDMYLSLTEFAKSKFVEAGWPAQRIMAKPNFVDPDPGVGPGDREFMMFTGRLTEEKGVRTLLRAWEIAGAETGLKLRILGDGPLRPFVQEAVLHSNGKIEHLGQRPLREVHQVMGESRAVIVPSEWYEGMPRTIAEAMATGAPVIAARIGSMAELVDHDRTGLQFTPGDPDDLVSQVRKLLGKPPSEIAQMRKAARAEFEARFTGECIYPMIIDSYQRAIARCRATGVPVREPENVPPAQTAAPR